jgi:hypothetical protein
MIKTFEAFSPSNCQRISESLILPTYDIHFNFIGFWWISWWEKSKYRMMEDRFTEIIGLTRQSRKRHNFGQPGEVLQFEI